MRISVRVTVVVLRKLILLVQRPLSAVHHLHQVGRVVVGVQQGFVDVGHEHVAVIGKRNRSRFVEQLRPVRRLKIQVRHFQQVRQQSFVGIHNGGINRIPRNVNRVRTRLHIVSDLIRNAVLRRSALPHRGVRKLHAESLLHQFVAAVDRVVHNVACRTRNHHLVVIPRAVRARNADHRVPVVLVSDRVGNVILARLLFRRATVAVRRSPVVRDRTVVAFLSATDRRRQQGNQQKYGKERPDSRPVPFFFHGMIPPFRVSEAFSAILYVHYSTAPPQLQLRKNRHSVAFSLYFFKNLSQCPISGVFFVHSEQIKAGKSRKLTHRVNESPSVCPVKAAKKRVVSPLFGLQPAECLKFYKLPGKRQKHRTPCRDPANRIL